MGTHIVTRIDIADLLAIRSDQIIIFCQLQNSFHGDISNQPLSFWQLQSFKSSNNVNPWWLKAPHHHPHPPTHSVFWQRTNRVERSWSAGDLRSPFKLNIVINYIKQLLALIKIWWESQTNKWYILITTILNLVKNDKDIHIYILERVCL